MDFFDPDARRNHTIRLLIGYVLFTVIVGFITLLLIYQARGFRFDRNTGRIRQEALTYVSSVPEGAQIYVDGKQSDAGTNARLSLREGSHVIRLARAGYQDWTRKLSFEGGTVVRLTYPRLVPDSLATTELGAFDGLVDVAESLDRHWLIYQPVEGKPELQIRDMTRPDLAAASYPVIVSALQNSSGAIGTLKTVEWADDNVHVLMRHDFKGISEFLLINRTNPADVINLNRTFVINPTRLTLRDHKSNQFYTYEQNGGVLRSAQLGTGLSGPLSSGVFGFAGLGGETVYIGASPTKTGVVNLISLIGDTSTTLAELPATQKNAYEVRIFNYAGDRFYAVASVDGDLVRIYKNPQSFIRQKPAQLPPPTLVIRLNQPQLISLSPTRQFLLIQQTNQFAVYDFDYNQLYRFQISGSVKAGQLARWVDNFRIGLVVDGRATICDFTGDNRYQIVTATEGWPLFIDKGFERLISVGQSTSSGKLLLQSTALKRP